MNYIYFLSIFSTFFVQEIWTKGANLNSNTKLFCYYGEIKETSNYDRCSHVILPERTELSVVENIKKKNPNVKILITVREFNEKLVDLLKGTRVDGVEINLKEIDSKNDVSDVVYTVKTRMASNLFIALTLPSKTEILAKYFDFKELSKKVDAFILSTDFLGASQNVTFHPSRLSGQWDMQNTDSMIDLVTGLGALQSKLVITAPVQAYEFTLQNGEYTAPGSPATALKSINRNELCEKMRGKGEEWTLERDQDQSGPYIFRGNEWIAFEDETSMDIKTKYARVRGLAGIALKDSSQDEETKCGPSLIETTFKGLSKQERVPRTAVLQNLEREILSTVPETTASVHNSPFRISRIIDTEGKIHVIRQDTRTEFECSRQGYFVHPRSCNRFYRCVKFDQTTDEFNVFEFDCPAGLAFDEKTEVCVWPGSISHASACSGSSEIAPVPKERFTCPSKPGYYADPENCRWFFSCIDLGEPQMLAYEFRCPFGLAYDEEKLLCEWPWLVPNCGSQKLRSVTTDFYGGASTSINHYDGLGVLHTVTLGGIQGYVENAREKTYSNVGLISSINFGASEINSGRGPINQHSILLQSNFGALNTQNNNGEQYFIGNNQNSQGSFIGLGQAQTQQVNLNSVGQGTIDASNYALGEQYSTGNAANGGNGQNPNSFIVDQNNQANFNLAQNINQLSQPETQQGQSAGLDSAYTHVDSSAQTHLNTEQNLNAQNLGGAEYSNSGQSNSDAQQLGYVQSTSQQNIQTGASQQQPYIPSQSQVNLNGNFSLQDNRLEKVLVENKGFSGVENEFLAHVTPSSVSYTTANSFESIVSATPLKTIDNYKQKESQSNLGIQYALEDSNELNENRNYSYDKSSAQFEQTKENLNVALQGGQNYQYIKQEQPGYASISVQPNVVQSAQQINTGSFSSHGYPQQEGFQYNQQQKPSVTLENNSQFVLKQQQEGGYKYEKPSVAFEEGPRYIVNSTPASFIQRPVVHSKYQFSDKQTFSHGYQTPTINYQVKPQLVQQPQVVIPQVPATSNYYRQDITQGNIYKAPTVIQQQPHGFVSSVVDQKHTILQQPQTVVKKTQSFSSGYSYNHPQNPFVQNPQVLLQQPQVQQIFNGYTYNKPTIQQAVVEQPQTIISGQNYFQPSSSYHQQTQIQQNVVKPLIPQGFSYAQHYTSGNYGYLKPQTQLPNVVKNSFSTSYSSGFTQQNVYPQYIQPVVQQPRGFSKPDFQQAAVQSYSYSNPSQHQYVVKPATILNNNHGTPIAVNTQYTEFNKGYSYPKPQVQFVEEPKPFVTTYQNKVPVVEAPIVPQKAYITGNSFHYQTNVNSHHIAQPAHIYTTPRPTYVSTIASVVAQQQNLHLPRQEVVYYDTRLNDAKIQTQYHGTVQSAPQVQQGYQYPKPHLQFIEAPQKQKVSVEQKQFIVGNNNYQYHQTYTIPQQAPIEPQQKIVSYTTPRPTYLSTVQSVVNQNLQPVQPAVSHYDSRFSATPATQIQFLESTTVKPTVTATYLPVADQKVEVQGYSHSTVQIQSYQADVPKEQTIVENYDNKQYIQPQVHVQSYQAVVPKEQTIVENYDNKQYIQPQVHVQSYQAVVPKEQTIVENYDNKQYIQPQVHVQSYQAVVPKEQTIVENYDNKPYIQPQVHVQSQSYQTVVPTEQTIVGNYDNKPYVQPQVHLQSQSYQAVVPKEQTILENYDNKQYIQPQVDVHSFTTPRPTYSSTVQPVIIKTLEPEFTYYDSRYSSTEAPKLPNVSTSRENPILQEVQVDFKGYDYPKPEVKFEEPKPVTTSYENLTPVTEVPIVPKKAYVTTGQSYTYNNKDDVKIETAKPIVLEDYVASNYQEHNNKKPEVQYSEQPQQILTEVQENKKVEPIYVESYVSPDYQKYEVPLQTSTLSPISNQNIKSTTQDVVQNVEFKGYDYPKPKVQYSEEPQQVSKVIVNEKVQPTIVESYVSPDYQKYEVPLQTSTAPSISYQNTQPIRQDVVQKVEINGYDYPESGEQYSEELQRIKVDGKVDSSISASFESSDYPKYQKPKQASSEFNGYDYPKPQVQYFEEPQRINVNQEVKPKIVENYASSDYQYKVPLETSTESSNYRQSVESLSQEVFSYDSRESPVAQIARVSQPQIIESKSTATPVLVQKFEQEVPVEPFYYYDSRLTTTVAPQVEIVREQEITNLFVRPKTTSFVSRYSTTAEPSIEFKSVPTQTVIRRKPDRQRVTTETPSVEYTLVSSETPRVEIVEEKQITPQFIRPKVTSYDSRFSSTAEPPIDRQRVTTEGPSAEYILVSSETPSVEIIEEKQITPQFIRPKVTSYINRFSTTTSEPSIEFKSRPSITLKEYRPKLTTAFVEYTSTPKLGIQYAEVETNEPSSTYIPIRKKLTSTDQPPREYLPSRTTSRPSTTISRDYLPSKASGRISNAYLPVSSTESSDTIFREYLPSKTISQPDTKYSTSRTSDRVSSTESSSSEEISAEFLNLKKISRPGYAVYKEYLPSKTSSKVSNEYLTVASTESSSSGDISVENYENFELVKKKSRPVKIVKIVRPKFKNVIVRKNDFNPFLSAKLEAQCTCSSKSLKLKKEPLKIEIPDDEEIYTDDGGEGILVKKEDIVVESYESEEDDEDNTAEVYLRSSSLEEPSSIYKIRKTNGGKSSSRNIVIEELQSQKKAGVDIKTPEVRISTQRVRFTTPRSNDEEGEGTVLRIKGGKGRQTNSYRSRTQNIVTDESESNQEEEVDIETPEVRISTPRVRVTTDKVDIEDSEESGLKIKAARGRQIISTRTQVPNIVVEEWTLKEKPRVDIETPEVRISNQRVRGTTPKVDIEISGGKIQGARGSNGVRSRSRNIVIEELESKETPRVVIEETSPRVRVTSRKLNIEAEAKEKISGRSRQSKSQRNNAIEVNDKDFERYGPGGVRSSTETLQGIDCQRAGLFRHPTDCSKFLSCVWDNKKNKFRLHILDCPVHLTFDNNLGACNWPSQGPACVGNTLLPSE